MLLLLDLCAVPVQVYGWQPEPFSNESLADDSDNKNAHDAMTLLGDRLVNDYIGVTCEGEVCANRTAFKQGCKNPVSLAFSFHKHRQPLVLYNNK